MAKEFETTCNDFGTRKGCGQKILMKQTNERKEDGKGYKWKPFELDGVFPHTHDNKNPSLSQVSQEQFNQQRQDRLTGGAPTSNPQANTNYTVQETRTTVLERQFATFLSEFEALKLKVAELEKQAIEKDANNFTNASEDELGEAADE